MPRDPDPYVAFDESHYGSLPRKHRPPLPKKPKPTRASGRNRVDLFTVIFWAVIAVVAGVVGLYLVAPFVR